MSKKQTYQDVFIERKENVDGGRWTMDDGRRGFVPQVKKRLVMKSFQPSLSLISHSSACRASFIPRAKLNRTLITQKK
jgi:hypothetical protein